MKILVLGGDGFIGRNCLEYFSNSNMCGQEYEVTAVLKNNFKYAPVPNVSYKFHNLTIETEVIELFNSDKYDIVLQMAASTTGANDVINRPWVHVTDNAVMNSWIFREAVDTGVKHVIFPSCTVMYQPMDERQSESDWSASDRIYDAYFGVGNTKVYLENMCEFFSSIGQTKFTAIRHSNVYGPYDKFDINKCHVLAAFVNKVVNGTDSIEIWGGGEARRDLLYIDDLVNMIDKVIHKQKTPYELYNCGDGFTFSVLELADIIMGLEGKHLEKVFAPSKPNIPTTVRLDCSKANEQLGWTPKWTLEEGLVETINWYKENYNKNELIKEDG